MLDRDPEYRRRIKAKHRDREQNANEEAREASRNARIAQIETSVKGIGERIDAYAEESSHRERGKRCREWLEIGALVLAAVVGVVAIVASGNEGDRQRHVMQSQINEMVAQRLDAEVQEAASISIKNFTIHGFPDNPIASYELVNDGHTRADQALPGVETGSFPLKDELKDLALGPGFASPNINGISLAPSDPPRHFNTPIAFFFDISDEQAKVMGPEFVNRLTRDAILKGDDVTVFVRVIVPYLDIFNKKHQTVECLIYRAQIKDFETCTGQHDLHQ